MWIRAESLLWNSPKPAWVCFKGGGKGKVSSHSALLYLRIQWNQIAQIDRKRKNDNLSKMEPLSIHSHETSLQFKLLAKEG